MGKFAIAVLAGVGVLLLVIPLLSGLLTVLLLLFPVALVLGGIALARRKFGGGEGVTVSVDHKADQ